MDLEQDLILYGNENKTFGDKVCAFSLALAPLLQHYKGLIENAGFTILLLITPILLLRTFGKLKVGLLNRKCFFAIIPLVAFFIYTILVRDFNAMKLGYVLLMVWIFMCVSNGSINVSYFFKYATWIALLAAGAIFVQYVSQNFFGRTIELRPLSLLVSQDVIWVRNAERMSDVGYISRPSGFFLEPSHFFLYTFPIITILLLSAKKNKKRFRTALFLSLGLLFSTSGMGVAFVLGIWLLYYALYRKSSDGDRVRIKELFTVNNVILFVFFGLVVLLAYRLIPFFQHSIDRIFTEEETTNAIDGRVRLARNYVRHISGRAVWFGTPNVIDELEFNLSGFFATYIKWGVFGLIFSYWFYIQGLFKLKGPYFWLSLIIVVVSYYSAHTHGTFYMLYYLIFLMNGYYETSIKDEIESYELDNSEIELNS